MHSNVTVLSLSLLLHHDGVRGGGGERSMKDTGIFLGHEKNNRDFLRL